jgi:hypothetical protein
MSRTARTSASRCDGAVARLCARPSLALRVSLLACVLLAVVFARPARGQGQRGPASVRLRGAATLDARAWSSGSRYGLRGRLLDDRAAPIAEAEVEVSFAAPVTDIEPCAGSAERTSPSAVRLRTDTDGALCLKGSVDLPGATIELRFAGTPYVDAQEQKVLISRKAELESRRLSFVSPPDSIDLDRERLLVVAELRGGAGDGPLAGERIELSDERGVTLASAQSGGDGRAQFEVLTTLLGGPGGGELRLAAAGATDRASVLRRAVVRLTAPSLSAMSPEDGVRIPLDVTWKGGAVQSGAVQALFGATSVGATAVAEGRADLVATFVPEAGATTRLSVRYLPDSPWLIPGPPLEVVIPLAPPRVWPRVVAALAAFAMVAWVTSSWRRAPRTERAEAPPSGRPGVQLLERGSTGEWTGRVYDAHDGAAIPGARVSVVVPTLEGEREVASALTDAAGEFALRWSGGDDARVVAEAALHKSYRAALPAAGRLAVSLVTRRRALLDHLVRWARSRGAPYDGPLEPTPGHVRRAAGRSGAPAVEAWAGVLEEVAFGPEPVGRAEETRVARAEPESGAPRPPAPPEIP